MISQPPGSVDNAVVFEKRGKLTVGGKTPAMCDVCEARVSLWLTGEWCCPKCGGPAPDIARILYVEYTSMVMYTNRMPIGG